jgi:hypothetical protein
VTAASGEPASEHRRLKMIDNVLSGENKHASGSDLRRYNFAAGHSLLDTV